METRQTLTPEQVLRLLREATDAITDGFAVEWLTDGAGRLRGFQVLLVESPADRQPESRSPGREPS